MTAAGAMELNRRMQMWRALGSGAVAKTADNRQLAKIGIRPFRTGQGIFTDAQNTTGIAPDGGAVTLSVLHNGSSYADDIDDSGVLYHYPCTNRGPSRDLNEINATKAAMVLELPIFVVSDHLELGRRVHLAWVVGFDDREAVFLLEFKEEPAKMFELSVENQPFELIVTTRRRQSTVLAREGQPRFKFALIQRYSKFCALCSIREVELLQGAHLCPVSAGGCNDPRNGLILCCNHHKALDCSLIAIEPGSMAIRRKPRLAALEEIGIVHPSLGHLRAHPHEAALEYLWERRDKVAYV